MTVERDSKTERREYTGRHKPKVVAFLQRHDKAAAEAIICRELADADYPPWDWPAQRTIALTKSGRVLYLRRIDVPPGEHRDMNWRV